MTGPLPPLADVNDVAAYLRTTFTGADQIAVQKWLRSLSSVIRSRIPSIDDRVASGALDADTVTMVLAFAVKRIGDFMAKSSEQTGVTYPEFGATFRQAPSSFADWITPSDWALLGWIAPIDSGAYSVRLGWPG